MSVDQAKFADEARNSAIEKLKELLKVNDSNLQLDASTDNSGIVIKIAIPKGRLDIATIAGALAADIAASNS